jgi:hypothetical protein
MLALICNACVLLLKDINYIIIDIKFILVIVNIKIFCRLFYSKYEGLYYTLNLSSHQTGLQKLHAYFLINVRESKVCRSSILITVPVRDF